MIKAYTDGACSGNPGPGGWGVLMQMNGETKELCGGEAATTNNRMELLAAIRALEEVKPGTAIAITTDSQYVKNGVETWVHGWKRNGWKTAAKKPVKNQDLWQTLDALAEARDVKWAWVKGHAGHEGNEAADALARQGMAPFQG
ncbi:ribonuclease HI [Parvularcula sp. ZS-1/3]|uniref:Ribonuclease H n=1 Tax=Parvularcula mediterranea TaxID=2732508 RepID=A0A7Y3W4E0_9PROT|nr:ribonuclease HI [Parvularcula mediterranea]NNU15429.1 ribonuclease HI [Parvularcula mediterranea]